MVLDHSVNRPIYVVPDFKKAIENFHANNPAISLDPQTWGVESGTNEKNHWKNINQPEERQILLLGLIH